MYKVIRILTSFILILMMSGPLVLQSLHRMHVEHFHRFHGEKCPVTSHFHNTLEECGTCIWHMLPVTPEMSTIAAVLKFPVFEKPGVTTGIHLNGFGSFAYHLRAPPILC